MSEVKLKKKPGSETDREKIQRLERQGKRNLHKFEGQRDKLLSDNQKNLNHLERGRALIHRVTNELAEQKKMNDHAAMRIQSLMTLIAVMVGKDQTLLIDANKVKDATGKWFIDTEEGEVPDTIKLIVRVDNEVEEHDSETESTLVLTPDKEVHSSEDRIKVSM